jgi:RNA polymerase sigma-70 factor (ECF subfamily)
MSRGGQVERNRQIFQKTARTAVPMRSKPITVGFSDHYSGGYHCETGLSESDENLIHRFHKTAQPELLETVLSRHLASVRSMVFQMLLDHNAADDVTQDVFLRVLRGLETFDGRSQFSTWLFRIAMNAVRSHITKCGRLRVQFQNELPEDRVSARTEPGGCALAAELTTEVQRALAQLSPQLRAAIVLVCLQGKSATDAAAIEDCSTDTMYWRVHEARKQLKSLLAEYLQ